MSALPTPAAVPRLQLHVTADPQRLLHVEVRRPRPGRQAGTHTSSYTALYESSFAAYDDALNRFPDALRIEVRPARGERPTTVPIVYPGKPSEAADAPR